MFSTTPGDETRPAGAYLQAPRPRAVAASALWLSLGIGKLTSDNRRHDTFWLSEPIRRAMLALVGKGDVRSVQIAKRLHPYS